MTSFQPTNIKGCSFPLYGESLDYANVSNRLAVVREIIIILKSGHCRLLSDNHSTKYRQSKDNHSAYIVYVCKYDA